MVRTHFSWKVRSNGYDVIDHGSAKLVAGPDGVLFYPQGSIYKGEVSLSWAEAWALYKMLEVLDGPQFPEDVAPPPPSKL